MYIAEKGISLPRQFVDIMAGENRQAAFLAKNPAGGLPCLELDDGSFLSESLAICEYLEELYPSPALIGDTAEQRAQTRSMIRSIDQNVVVPMTNGFRSSEGLALFKDRLLCVPSAAEGNKAYARDGMASIDSRLADGGWLCGSRFSLADILLFAFVDFGNQVGQPVPDSLPNLKAWSERIAARPSAVVSANPSNGV